MSPPPENPTRSQNTSTQGETASFEHSDVKIDAQRTNLSATVQCTWIGLDGVTGAIWGGGGSDPSPNPPSTWRFTELIRNKQMKQSVVPSDTRARARCPHRSFLLIPTQGDVSRFSFFFFFKKSKQTGTGKYLPGLNEGRDVDMWPGGGEQLAPVEPRPTAQWQLYVRGGVMVEG